MIEDQLATRKCHALTAITTSTAAIAAASGNSAERFFGSGGFDIGAGFAAAGVPTCSE